MNNEYRINEGSFYSKIGGRTHLYYKHIVSGNLTNDSIHLIFQHGLLEYHLRHKLFFDYLTTEFKERGIVISCMDLVGHGNSGGNRAYIDNFSTFDHDFSAFLNSSTQEFGLTNVFVMGHSLGGLIVLKKTIELDRVENNVKGVILTNPCIGIHNKYILRIKKNIKSFPEWLRKVRVPIYNHNQLTHDAELARSFVSDHLISKFVTIGLGSEIITETQKISFSSYFLKSSCLFLLSDQDTIVDNEKTKLYITSMNQKYVQLEEFSNAYHDILNEKFRIDVYDRIKEFIVKRI